jgi:hypothetical protein
MIPNSPGQWVVDNSDSDRPMIGLIKNVYVSVLPWESDVLLVDIVIYHRHGEKIGRESPPCGGPISYEPACRADNWVVVEKPDFPLKSNSVGAYRHLLKLA